MSMFTFSTLFPINAFTPNAAAIRSSSPLRSSSWDTMRWVLHSRRPNDAALHVGPSICHLGDSMRTCFLSCTLLSLSISLCWTCGPRCANETERDEHPPTPSTSDSHLQVNTSLSFHLHLVLLSLSLFLQWKVSPKKKSFLKRLQKPEYSKGIEGCVNVLVN